jgi:hypothetical protein
MCIWLERDIASRSILHYTYRSVGKLSATNSNVFQKDIRDTFNKKGLLNGYDRVQKPEGRGELFALIT